MGTGYIRNDTANNIADGNVIDAADLDGEFDAIQSAFSGSSGHSHDGTTGQGPQIDASGIANNAVALGTKTTGDYVASLTEGALIDLQNNSGEGATPTINVDLTELTDMTETAVGADELVILDGGTAQKRKAISEIPLSIFNNDSGFGAGDITGVAAGTGLSGGGTSGDVTLNLDFSELTDMTGSASGTTEFILQDGTTESRKAASEIDLSIFNNNLSIDADNTTISNLEVDNLKSGILDTDISSVAGTDTTLASAKAIKTYVDAQVGGVSSNVSSDTNPSLGGNLDLNSKNITGTGNIDNTGTITTDGLTVAGNVSVDGGTIKLDGNLDGNGNVALGDEAASNASLGQRNVAIGNEALKRNNGGAYNVCVGYSAGDAISGGDKNTLIGYRTGSNTQVTDISNTTAVGYLACEETEADRNTGIGSFALMRGGSQGTNNVAVGYNSHAGTSAVLPSAYTGGHNTSVGASSLADNKTGNSNVAIGYLTMSDALTDCDQNVAVGNGALQKITDASSLNTVIGYDAGNEITTGQKNTILGSYDGNESGLDIRTSDNNIVLADGDGNIRYHGDSTGEVTIPGSSSSYVSTDSLSGIRMHFNSSTGAGIIGAYNSDSSLFSGYSTLAFHTSQSGSGSTETQARMSISGTGNVDILGGNLSTSAGSAATPAIQLDDTNTGFYKAATNEIGMVTDGTERVRIDSSGAVGIGTVSPTGTALSLKGSLPPLVIDNNSAIDSTVFKNTVRFRDHEGNTVANINMHEAAVQYNTGSDHRLKENVEGMTGAISRVKQLAPKRFSWIKANLDAPNVDGFMAHEAQTVVPEAVSGTHNEVDDDGNAVMQGIDHSKLVPLLTGALQEAIAKIETLETKVAALEAGS